MAIPVFTVFAYIPLEDMLLFLESEENCSVDVILSFGGCINFPVRLAFPPNFPNLATLLLSHSQVFQ